MTADHLKLIRSSEYREVVADRLASLPKAQASRMTVVHEPDGSCCRTQPWGATLRLLLDTAAARRGFRAAVVAVGSEQ